METDDHPAETSRRKLDVAKAATVDKVALNNKVIKLRPTVDKAKVYIIHSLTRKIKKLKGRRGQDEKVLEKFKRKWQRLVEEIQVIKHLKPDKIAMFAFGNTKTLKEVCDVPDHMMENRALTRLSEHKLIQEEVKKFRAEHDDWKSLSAYLMSRNSGRRFKKKKLNKVEKIITNVRAGEVMIKSFLEGKFDSDCPQMERVKQDKFGSLVSDTLRRDVRDKQNDSAEAKGCRKEDQLRKKTVKKVTKIIDDDKDGEEEEDSYIKRKNKLVSDSDESDRADDDDSDESDHADDDDSHESDHADDENSDDDSNNAVKERTSSGYRGEQSHGEVVVTKLNLEKMEDSEDDKILRDADSIPSFLTKTASNSVKSIKSKARKDAFFVTSDLDSGSENENENEKQSIKENDLSSDEEITLGRGMKAFNSSFMGSLSEKKWRKTAEKRRKDTGTSFFNNQQKSTVHKPISHKGPKTVHKGANTVRKGEKRYKESRKGPKEYNTRKPGGGKMLNQKNKLSSKTSVCSTYFKNSTDNKEGKLHPSWQASRKRKEQAKLQAFQGKKIKFDDND